MKKVYKQCEGQQMLKCQLLGRKKKAHFPLLKVLVEEEGANPKEEEDVKEKNEKQKNEEEEKTKRRKR